MDQNNQSTVKAAHNIPYEVMMLRAATEMQVPAHQMQYHPQQHQHLAHSQHARHSIPPEYGDDSFTDGDSHMRGTDKNDENSSMAAIVGAPKSTGSRPSANNEAEMRNLFQSNSHRNLPEVAGELHGDERGPNSERTRQIFAMLWIKQACSAGKGSVPRGRVYANYASRCATERITVLNPASFGKLVRVLHPGLSTRRLGVRGESKYHYVNFALRDDQPEVTKSPSPSRSRMCTIRRSIEDSKKLEKTPSPAALPSPATVANVPAAPARGDTSSSLHSVYNIADMTNMDNAQSTSHKTPVELAFMSQPEQDFRQAGPVELPPIEPYLPAGTDTDAAKALSAVYRSHCTSLIECIRFCKGKAFFHLFTSFQGTLTMPVQRLFAKPELAAWIEACDLVLYQKMMGIVSSLVLQVLPRPVMQTLRNICDKLVGHIRESFEGQPQHVVVAKEGPAVLFANLLDRALRVNLAAHAAANMLSESNRNQMYLDLITMVKPRKLAESVPTRAMDDVVRFLVTEMRGLIDPGNVPWEVECLTVFGETAARAGRQGDNGEGGGDASGAFLMDRWVAMVRQLPERFPYATPQDIVLGVERLGSALMRELTIQTGTSFGAWWIIKVWLDEMVAYMAMEGGFMKTTKLLERGEAPARAKPASKEMEKQSEPDAAAGSRRSPLGDHPNTNGQPNRAPFPPLGSGARARTPDDDSGLEIRTPENELPMKFA